MERTEIAALLTQNGLRPTQQRLAVYEFLLRRPHPCAETVYTAVSREHPSFSRTTVYNSLHALADAGLVIELTVSGTPERRYDVNTLPHGHFLCLGCRTLYDVPVDKAAVQALQPAGFTVTGQTISFTGLCPRCSAAEKRT